MVNYALFRAQFLAVLLVLLNGLLTRAPPLPPLEFEFILSSFSSPGLFPLIGWEPECSNVIP